MHTPLRACAHRALTALVWLAAALAPAAASRANVYVADWLKGTVGLYTNAGVPINASLITGLTNPYGLSIVGANLFVNNAGTGVVGEYTLDGKTVNAHLFADPEYGAAMVAVGSTLYLAHQSTGTVSAYNASGALIKKDIITGLYQPSGITTDGSALYVTSIAGVVKTALDGTIINDNLVVRNPGLNDPYAPVSATVVGSDLYVLFNRNAGIGKYALDGTVETRVLASNFFDPVELSTDGTDLYVGDYTGTVTKLSTAGVAEGSPLFSVTSNAYGILATPVPEPAAFMTVAVAFGAMTARRRCRRRPREDRRIG